MKRLKHSVLALSFSAVALFAPAFSSAATPADLPADLAPRIERWQPRVERYLTVKDKERAPHVGGVVFTGSSSIDMWQTLAADFATLPVVNRGIGGTWLADQLHLAPKLVYPLKPHTVVLYAGENDLKDQRTAGQVALAFEQVRDQLFAALPDARLVFIAVKPSPSRAALLPAMRDANARIAAACAQHPRCTFVDVFTPMLNEQGEPRPELFLEDQLHMNATGYQLWTKLVAPVLQMPR